MAGIPLDLHPVLSRSIADPVVRDSRYDEATGTFVVPARTTAVLWKDTFDLPRNWLWNLLICNELNSNGVGTGRVAYPRRPPFMRGHKFKATNADGPLGDRTLPPPLHSRASVFLSQPWTNWSQQSYTVTVAECAYPGVSHVRPG